MKQAECTAADRMHADQLEPTATASKSRCPFGGSVSQTSVQTDQLVGPPTSAQSKATPINLSVSFPPREYLAFKNEAYKIDLRLDRIAIDDIFEIDEEYEADMKRKAHILATRPVEMMLLMVPEVGRLHLPSCCSLANLVWEHVSEHAVRAS